MDALFEAQRRLLATEPQKASRSDYQWLASEAFREAEERNRRSFLETPSDHYEEAREFLIDDEIALRDGLKRPDNLLPSLQASAEELLARKRLQHQPGDIEYWAFLRLLLRAELESTLRQRDRFSGDPADRVYDRRFGSEALKDSASAPPSSDITMRELIRKYESEPAREGLASKTVQAYRIIFRALREILGEDKPAVEIARAECKRLQEVLSALPPNTSKKFPGMPLDRVAAEAKAQGLRPLHPKTLKNYLFNLSALFNWGVAEGYMKTNPAMRLRVAPGERRGRSREPFASISW